MGFRQGDQGKVVWFLHKKEWNQGETNVPMASKSGSLFGNSMQSFGQWANSFHTNFSQEAYLGLVDGSKAKDVQLAWNSNLGRIQVTFEQKIHVTPPHVQK